MRQPTRRRVSWSASLLLPVLLELVLLSQTAAAVPQVPTLPHERREPNQLTSLEAAAGWQLLFDGVSTSGWQAMGSDDFPAEGWEVSDGCLHLVAPGTGDIVTTRDFGDFELLFEWKVAPGTNSGLKYRVPFEAGRRAMLGPEFQVLDDATAEVGARHQAGALYALYEASNKALRPAGEFNRSRILARGGRIEHWINGSKVLSCDAGSEDWAKRKAASKFAKVANFAMQPGRIGLQDHGGEVWYRNLRIRHESHLPGEAVALVNGKDLEGWMELGDAVYEVAPDSILGYVGGGGQSFLVSTRRFGDFVFEVDLKPELPGNSGIQIRSQLTAKKRLYGYQIEIDSSPRAWSGGLYDEGRRAWLDNLEDNPAGRAAFRPGDWNRYRIECVGPWIRSWVNGVPVADYLDAADLAGHLALQVHSGNNTRVQWKNFRMQHFGYRHWVERTDLPLTEQGEVRLRLSRESFQRLHFRSESEQLHLLIARPEQQGSKLLYRTLHRSELPPPGNAGQDNRLEILRLGDRLAVNMNGRQCLDQFRLPADSPLIIRLVPAEGDREDRPVTATRLEELSGLRSQEQS